MRVTVLAAELADAEEVTGVLKQADGVTYRGVRFHLKAGGHVTLWTGPGFTPLELADLLDLGAAVARGQALSVREREWPGSKGEPYPDALAGLPPGAFVPGRPAKEAPGE